MNTGESEVLMKSNGEEIEVLSFTIGKSIYGINVEKVQEIIPYQKVQKIPCSHPSVLGVFMPRKKAIAAIDLANCLGMEPVDESEEAKPLFLICHFNNTDIAFLIKEVIAINRISKTEIIIPNRALLGENSSVSGIIKVGDELVSILDFEKLLKDINPDTYGEVISDVIKEDK